MSDALREVLGLDMRGRCAAWGTGCTKSPTTEIRVETYANGVPCLPSVSRSRHCTDHAANYVTCLEQMRATYSRHYI